MSTEAPRPDALASGPARALLAFPVARHHDALRPPPSIDTAGAATLPLEVPITTAMTGVAR